MLVVSYFGRDDSSPRGVRTQRVLRALARDWTCHLVAARSGPISGAPKALDAGPLTRTAIGLGSHVLLDRYEIWSRAHLQRARSTTAALLVGYPFSPLITAQAWLSKAGIPYVVDAGDPWVLNNPTPAPRGVARVRARRGESNLWRYAAGAILTTRQHAEALRVLFPSLSTLVRPNGVDPTTPVVPRPPRRADDGVLRLAHFGSMYRDRVDPTHFLTALGSSEYWRGVEVHQYGPDAERLLGTATNVFVTYHDRVPWNEAVALTHQYDAVIALLNRNTAQVPSKLLAYRQLPLPRIAISPRESPTSDEAAFVADPSWLFAGRPVTTHSTAHAVLEHVSRPLHLDALHVAPEHQWTNVAATIASFIHRVTSNTVR